MEEKPLNQRQAESTEVNQDELILQQQKRIEKEISESIALVGKKESLKALESEYAEDEVYLSKAKILGQKYSFFRRTRPDGNCFFRAFSYAYLEKLISNKEEYERFRELALKSKDNLVALGFPQFTVEDFHDTFMEVIDKVGGGTDASYEELHKLFNEQCYSDYVVVYLRLITSGQLQREAEFYQHFIEGDRTVKEFCHQEVEPMYRESDHIHIIAMSTALGTGVRVRYMDRGAGTEVTAHDFPENATPSVHLLYRPEYLCGMASASSTSARSLFVESKMRLADRVQVNVNNIASLARQIQRGSRSNDILMHSVKNFTQQEHGLENATNNLKKLAFIMAQCDQQLDIINRNSAKLEEVTEQVRAMQR